MLVFMFQEFMCSGVSRVSGFIYVGLKYVSLCFVLVFRVLGQKIRWIGFVYGVWCFGVIVRYSAVFP
jgi:hypothetical protein